MQWPVYPASEYVGSATKFQLKGNVPLVYAVFSKRKPALTPLMVGGETIQLATTVRNLGVTLDSHLLTHMFDRSARKPFSPA